MSRVHEIGRGGGGAPLKSTCTVTVCLWKAPEDKGGLSLSYSTGIQKSFSFTVYILSPFSERGIISTMIRNPPPPPHHFKRWISDSGLCVLCLLTSYVCWISEWHRRTPPPPPPPSPRGWRPLSCRVCVFVTHADKCFVLCAVCGCRRTFDLIPVSVSWWWRGGGGTVSARWLEQRRTGGGRKQRQNQTLCFPWRLEGGLLFLSFIRSGDTWEKNLSYLIRFWKTV